MSTHTHQSAALETALNVQVANWTLLGMKLHHYHWYVKGPQFFTLHEKFEELYNEAAGYVDELAERLLAIGGQPVSTLKQSIELSTLEEAKGGEEAKAMVAELVKDLGVVARELTETIPVAEEGSDQPTADLLIGMRASIEKHMWMLNAFLG